MTGNLEDYEVLSIIGTGSFGTCYKVKKKNNGQLFVWKAIGYGGMSEEKKQLLVSEVNLLSELRHQNIVQYYDRIIHKESTTLYIVMEWCQGGDISSLINKCKKTGSFLDEGFVWRVLYQMCRALQACHWHLSKVTVLHRDIKPANVFLDGAGNVKLGDFGLARILHEDMSYAQTTVGTPYYMSPEVIRGGKYNKKSDIWSLGCLVYELCSLAPPFTGSNIKQLALKIKEGKFSRIPAHYSDDLQKIIGLLLSIDQNLRPTTEVLLHHPTVVTNVTHESFKNGLSKNAESGSDITKKEKLQEMNVEEFTKIEQNLNNIHISCNEKGELPGGNKSYETMCNEKIRDIWLTRMQVLKQRETSLRLKELAIDERERSLAKKEKQLAVLDRLAKDKITRADVYLRQCREVRSVASSIKPVPQQRIKSVEYEDLDTSFSADPGDTSILPTTAKLKPETVPKPSPFIRIGSERRVRFDTLPRTKPKTKYNELELTSKENQYIPQYAEIPANFGGQPTFVLYDIPELVSSNVNKTSSRNDLSSGGQINAKLYELPGFIPTNVPKMLPRNETLHEKGTKYSSREVNKIEEDNYRNGVLASLNSNQCEKQTVLNYVGRPPSRAMSWKEERVKWLESKRHSFSLGTMKVHKKDNKENIEQPLQQKTIGTSTATVSSVPESGLGSLLSFR